MTVFIISLLSASVIMSVITLLLLVFFKKMPQLLSAKTRYTIWVLVLLAFVIPIRPSFGTGLIQLPSPVMTEITESFQSPPIAQTDTTLSVHTEPSAVSVAPQRMGTYLLVVSLIVWGTGVIMTFTRHVWQYYRFRQMVLRWGEDESDCNVLDMLAVTLRHYGVESNRISIKRCPLIKSPMLIGFIRPMILLPITPLSDEAMSMVLEHEVIHYVHKDVWINLLGMIAMSLHWFNPLVKLCCIAMQEEGEAFCDATLLAGRSLTYRRSYGEMIIQSLSRGVSEPIALSTCFYGKKFDFKKRILSIMDTSNKLKRFSFVVVTSVLSFIVLSGSIIVLVQPSVQEAEQVVANIIEEIPVKTAVAKEVKNLPIPTDKEIEAIRATIQPNNSVPSPTVSSQNIATGQQATTSSSTSNRSTSTVADDTTNVVSAATNNATSTNSSVAYQDVSSDTDTDDVDDIYDIDDDDYDYEDDTDED